MCKALDRARTSALKSVQQPQQEARAQQDVAAVLAAEAQQAQTATLKAEVETPRPAKIAKLVIETDSVHVEKGNWVYIDDLTHRQTGNLEEYRRRFGGNPWK